MRSSKRSRSSKTGSTIISTRLEQFDLIRIRSFQPELEYVFKHASDPGGGLQRSS